MRETGLRLVAVCIALAIAPVTTADEVRFDGQSFMVGELKRLERGRLYFKTSATDTISLQWDKVGSVTSSQQLEIELIDGKLLYGSLAPSGKAGELSIRRQHTRDGSESVLGYFVGSLTGAEESDRESASTDGGLVSQPMLRVVRITPIEEEFLERFDGNLSAGMSLTKANDYQQFSFGVDLEYLTERYYSTLDASALITDSKDSGKSEHERLQIRTSRRLKNRWYTGGLLSFESNEELGIDLRSSVGLAVGRNIMNTNNKRLLLDGGLIYTKEEIAESSETRDSAEGFVGLQYEWFNYDHPEFDLTTQLRVIPSLTESGRVRGNLSVVFSWEIFEDFDWQLSFYDSYDNEPPGGDDSSTNDYSLVTGIAWDM